MRDGSTSGSDMPELRFANPFEAFAAGFERSRTAQAEAFLKSMGMLNVQTGGTEESAFMPDMMSGMDDDEDGIIILDGDGE